MIKNIVIFCLLFLLLVSSLTAFICYNNVKSNVLISEEKVEFIIKVLDRYGGLVEANAQSADSQEKFDRLVGIMRNCYYLSEALERRIRTGKDRYYPGGSAPPNYFQSCLK